MPITFKSLKNLHKDCKVKYIHNDIMTYREFIEDEFGNIKAIQIPMTDNKIYSNWKIGVEVKYKGDFVIAWFSCSKYTNNLFLDYVYNGGTGKKLRRDAKNNIAVKYFYNNNL